MENHQPQPQKHSFLSSFQQYLQLQFNAIQNKFNQVNQKINTHQNNHLKHHQSINHLKDSHKLLDAQIKVILNKNITKNIEKSIQNYKQNPLNKQNIQNNAQMQFPTLKPKQINCDIQTESIQTQLNPKDSLRFSQIQQESFKNTQKVIQLMNSLNQTNNIQLPKAKYENIESSDINVDLIEKRLRNNIQNFLKRRISQIQSKFNLFIKQKTSHPQEKYQYNNSFQNYDQTDYTALSNNQQNLTQKLKEKFETIKPQINQSKVQITSGQTLNKNLKNQFDLLHKKFTQLQYSFNNLQGQVHNQLQKAKQSTQRYEHQVQFLRNQLEQYKLKKQAKYIKLMASQSNSNNAKVNNAKGNKPEIRNSPVQQRQIFGKNHTKSGSDHHNTSQEHNSSESMEYIGYLAEKIHFLTSANKELVRKHVYDKQIEMIKESLYYIRKRISDKVSYEELNKIQSIEDLQTLKKPQIIKGSSEQRENQLQNIQKKREQQRSQTQPQKEDQNPELQQKDPQLYLSELKNQINPQRVQNMKQKLLITAQIQERLSQNLQKMNKIETILSNQEEFLKQMNKFYNQKLNNLQLSVQKIQSYKLKHQNSIQSSDFFNQKSKTDLNDSLQNLGSQILQGSHPIFNSAQYNVKHHLNQKMFSMPAQQNDKSIKNNRSESILEEKKKIFNPETYNFQLNNVRRKISKLNSKHQLTEKNIKTFKQEILREISQIKKTEFNKTDWQSFKKAIKYFDEKIKLLQDTLKIVVITLQQEGTLNDQKGGQSISPQVAAKKKWSCLFCDKQMKNYEGKVSEIKYLGISQNHRYESPRAGGYYKQSLKDKQYDKIYLDQKISNSNQSIHRSLVKKRVGSIGKPNEINSLGKSNQLLKNLNEQDAFDYRILDDKPITGFQ